MMMKLYYCTSIYHQQGLYFDAPDRKVSNFQKVINKVPTLSKTIIGILLFFLLLVH